MSQLKNLTYLDLGGNGINEIPSFVKNLPNLTGLRLAFNDLADLPSFLGALPKLNSIDLANNCKITMSKPKMRELRQRFPKVAFVFEDEYDCPGEP
jgi:Leucine-rich repeat (LRR) protein